MNDHSHYQELTALAAGGLLSDEESRDLRDHLTLCGECRSDTSEFSDLVRSGLPLTRDHRFDFVGTMRDRPEAGARERFLERARREGIRFSPAIEKPVSRGWFHVGYQLAGAAALAAVILVVGYYGIDVRRRAVQNERAQAQGEVDRLKRENSTLVARLAELNGQLAKQGQQLRDARNQSEELARTADSYRRDSRMLETRSERSTSRNVQLLDELQNQEKRLGEAKDEIARINQLRQADEGSLVAQQIRINEISDQLRIASATLDMERQLAAAGRDIRELMVARQLHVVDVRDTDTNGKPSRSFGRVFLTEGKSLVFYAFDLTDAKSIDAKARFQVWASKQNLAQSLGFLYVDDKAQRRWALKINNPELLNEINSVFVTVARPGGDNKPQGQPLLYAYLGEPNHR